jgi:hypothetical protein
VIVVLTEAGSVLFGSSECTFTGSRPTVSQSLLRHASYAAVDPFRLAHAWMA